jgi:DNA (cytosine-5)-methyltransferase 1
MNYYNEIDPFAAQWIRNLIEAELIPKGIVDARSIKEVTPSDLSGFRQCHFFAGIAGWSLALQLAEWPAERECWTGSCPCQPFSAAGKRKGTQDERHLWPEFFRLIKACGPAVVMGEQVASKDGLAWLDGVFADCEGEGYTCWACDTCAAGVQAPHIRQRLYWLADAQCPESRSGEPGVEGRTGSGRNRLAIHRAANHRLAITNTTGQCPDAIDELHDAEHHTKSCGDTNRLEHAAGDGRNAWGTEPDGRSVAGGCELGGVGDTSGAGLQERGSERDIQPRAGCAPQGQATKLRSPWSNYHIIPCRDNKARRISAEPGDEPLATGIPRDLGRGESKLRRMAIRAARANRVGRLKGYGNAICPQTAAEFIKAFFEAGT